MGGINTTGVHDPSEYLIGRGKLYFAEIDTNGHPKNYRDVGNVPEMTATVSSETYDHYNSREGIRERDLRIILQQDATMSCILENINFQNLAVFFSGDAESYTNPGIAGFTDARICQDGDLAVNTWYAIVDGSNNPVFGITATNAISVESTNATPVALVKDTDYTVDSVSGKIFVLNTATVQSVITAGDGLQCTLTADGSATTVDKINVLSATELNLAIRFESISAETGDLTVYDIHKATVAADGDFSLISDEAAQLPLTIGIETSSAYTNPVDIYYPKTQA